jgi:hypothetical protein
MTSALLTGPVLVAFVWLVHPPVAAVLTAHGSMSSTHGLTTCTNNAITAINLLACKDAIAHINYKRSMNTHYPLNG